MPHRHNLVMRQSLSISFMLGKSTDGAFPVHVIMGYETTMWEGLPPRWFCHQLVYKIVLPPLPNHCSKEVNSLNTRFSQTRIYEAIEYGKLRIILGIHRVWSSPNFVPFWLQDFEQNYFGSQFSYLENWRIGPLISNISDLSSCCFPFLPFLPCVYGLNVLRYVLVRKLNNNGS